MEWWSDNSWVAWLGLAAALGVVEMFSLDLIFMMLAVGALTGAVAGAFDLPLALQLLAAAGASLATLTLLRPRLVARLRGGPELTLGHDRLLGTQGQVTVRISATDVGRVRLAGEEWTAAPYDTMTTIEPSETVEVLQIRGATAYVHPVPRLES